MRQLINTRKDLDSIAGKPEYFAFLKNLYGSRIIKKDIAEYPEGYDKNMPSDAEGYIAPNIIEISNLVDIERFGFTIEELEGLLGINSEE